MGRKVMMRYNPSSLTPFFVCLLPSLCSVSCFGPVPAPSIEECSIVSAALPFEIPACEVQTDVSGSVVVVSPDLQRLLSVDLQDAASVLGGVTVVVQPGSGEQTVPVVIPITGDLEQAVGNVVWTVTLKDEGNKDLCDEKEQNVAIIGYVVFCLPLLDLQCLIFLVDCALFSCSIAAFVLAFQLFWTSASAFFG